MNKIHPYKKQIFWELIETERNYDDNRNLRNEKKNNNFKN
jgi:hypothetical protein